MPTMTTEILITALKKIIDPISFMRSELEEGEQLDGFYANELSNDANYLKNIAKAAMHSYASSKQEGQPDADNFMMYVMATRDSFVKAIDEQKWDTLLRTKAEDLLICFDQMRERLHSESIPSPVQPTQEWIKVVENLMSEIKPIKKGNWNMESAYEHAEKLLLSTPPVQTAGEQWILEKENKPDFGIPVLGWNDIYGRWIYTYEQIGGKDSVWGNWHDGKQLGVLPPTHWCYLPQPPTQ